MNKEMSIRDFTMIMVLGLIWIFFYNQNPEFIGSRNLSNLAIELSIISVLALGMLVVLLTGEIDLSVGSGVGLLGGIACVLIFNYSWPAWAAMLAALAVAVVLWSSMGVLITSFQVPSFIITLGGLLIFKGLFWMVINSQTVSVSKGGEQNLLSMLTTFSFSTIVSFVLLAGVCFALFVSMQKRRKMQKEYGFESLPYERDYLKVFIICQLLLLMTLVLTQFRGVPLSLVILGVAATVIYILTKHTAFGRYLYAIGGNKEAAVISGIPVQKIMCFSYVILGCFVALTGFMQAAYQGSSTTTVGELMELDAIAACVIGGTSLKGGRGSVGGVIIGALIMTSLLNGMTLMAVSPENKLIARGSVLVLAVWLDVFFAKKKK
ncbi:MAG: hypothetical protein NE334_21530 [Lentisphaeraceae bacterium]|nr:hypothetical protein [Lentisphaeraceae bacterium]